MKETRKAYDDLLVLIRKNKSGLAKLQAGLARASRAIEDAREDG